MELFWRWLFSSNLLVEGSKLTAEYTREFESIIARIVPWGMFAENLRKIGRYHPKASSSRESGAVSIHSYGGPWNWNRACVASAHLAAGFVKLATAPIRSFRPVQIDPSPCSVRPSP